MESFMDRVNVVVGDNEDLGDALTSVGIMLGFVPPDDETVHDGKGKIERIKGDQGELENVVRAFMFTMDTKWLESTMKHIRKCRKGRA
jgi:hypothetical protein